MDYKYFLEKELACSCDKCTTEMDAEFMERLISLREHCDFPFKLTSAYRCEKHNKDVGGYPGSYHVKGRAVDIQVYGAKAHKLLSLVRRYGFMGVGISAKGNNSQRFIHIDDREHAAVWSY